MKIIHKNPMVTLVAFLYFFLFGCSPIWTIVIIGPQNIVWKNLWLGPAMALAVLILCWSIEKSEKLKNNKSS